MRTLIIFTSILCFTSLTITAQNPFKSIGKKGKVVTLSDGKYDEVTSYDSLQRIGSVIVNIRTKKIIHFIEIDTVYSESTLEPTIISRHWSIDPLTRKYPEMSPYSAFANNPIYFIDPDGREPIKPQAGTVYGFTAFLNNTRTKMGTLTGAQAKDAMLRLGQTAMDWKHLRPMPTTTPPFNSSPDRYIYTEKGGWLDMTHFLFYAGKAYAYKTERDAAIASMKSPSFAYLPPAEQSRIISEAGINPVGEAVQDGYLQELSDRFAAPYSAYSYEDLPSDKFGADFGANYFDPNSKLTLSQQLSNYLNNVLKATSPDCAPNYQCLPETEPTKKPSATNSTTNPSTPLCTD